MTYRSKFIVTFVIALLNVCEAYGQTLGKEGKGQNAAVKYLRADASLRQSYSLRTDAWVSLEDALNRPLTADDEKLVSFADDALAEFEHGTNIERCDWEVSLQDGPFANTAHRGAVRELVAVAQLRARIRFRERQNRGAIEDVLSGYTAARHLSLDGSIASVLFGYRVEAEVSGVLEKNLNSLQPFELAELESGLLRLPRSSSMRGAIESEKLSRNDLLAVVQGATSRDDLIRRMLRGIPFLKGDEKKAAEVVDGCGGSVPGVIDCIEKQSAFYRKWASRFSLSPEQFQEQYETDFAQASLGNPVIALFTPSFSRFRWAEAYNATRRALIQAAVAVKSRGTGELTKNPDPYDGSLFSYSPLPTGFKLASRLRENGSALSISTD